MKTDKMNQQKEKIRSFLSGYIKGKEYSDSDDIFAGGFVNSLLAMELIVFLEKEFSIRIENNDLKLDNFRSVNAMIKLLDSKK